MPDTVLIALIPLAPPSYAAFASSTMLDTLGVSFGQTGLPPATSTTYFLKSIELNPNYTLAYFNMGRAYQAMGEKTHSAEYYQMAIDLNKITNELNEQDILERLHKLFE